MIDSKMAGLLSDFFLDIAKAFFITTFITTELGSKQEVIATMAILLRGMISVIIALWFSRQFLEIKDFHESN